MQLRAQLQKEKPGVDLTWAEITGRGFGPMPTDSRVLMSATGFYCQPGSGAIDSKQGRIWWDEVPQPPLWKYFATGAACSEIEVDCLTGEVVITRAGECVIKWLSLPVLVCFCVEMAIGVLAVDVSYCFEQFLIHL